MSTPRLTAFRWSAGPYRGDGEEQQNSQNDGLHDDCCVERTADGRWRMKGKEFFVFFQERLGFVIQIKTTHERSSARKVVILGK